MGMVGALLAFFGVPGRRCYWVDPNVAGDRALRQRQSTAWDGLHDLMMSGALILPARHDLHLAFAVGEGDALLLGQWSSSNPTSGLPHPPLLVSRARMRGFSQRVDARGAI